ncbi:MULTISPECIES: SgcJ/EcaC family oxidoreductase [unclassified Rathayibacter]|uniref:SgcJ/EcaC family oxidoreductase n=1 Tax=unclassified Rathayibacter TaxID=2609250 RepID=UPI000F4CAEC0|nr:MULTISPECIES: SgcJ/EcaC family oxidoreductase [unclassified Rathayibacter]MCJ1704332.1 SgcJ/EcaC family oxidoreductase [Rathayibacter sp. VKM Ac-2926]
MSSPRARSSRRLGAVLAPPAALLLVLAGCSAAPAPAASTATAAAAVAAPTDAEVRGLFDEWNAALATGDPAQVDALYADDAVLLPTVAPGVLDTSAERIGYFDAFLKKRPTGTIDESVVRDLGDGYASNTGLYTFALAETGELVHARFTFVYEEIDGEWKIIEHHSSKEPVTP